MGGDIFHLSLVIGGQEEHGAKSWEIAKNPIKLIWLTFYYLNEQLQISYYLLDMKNYPLSTFQKEQYTQYLETQLEKFSAFMLSQKK